MIVQNQADMLSGKKIWRLASTTVSSRFKVTAEIARCRDAVRLFPFGYGKTAARNIGLAFNTLLPGAGPFDNDWAAAMEKMRAIEGPGRLWCSRQRRHKQVASFLARPTLRLRDT